MTSVTTWCPRWAWIWNALCYLTAVGMELCLKVFIFVYEIAFILNGFAHFRVYFESDDRKNDSCDYVLSRYAR